MRTITSRLLLAGGLALLAACGDATTTAESGAATTPTAADGDGWTSADLSQTRRRLPLVVMAPQGYTLDDTTSSEAVEIGTDAVRYSVLDLGEMAPQDAVKGYLDEAKSANGFTRVVQESPEGYIVQIGTGFIPYRTVAVGGQHYEMRVIPLYALPDETAARELYGQMGQAKAK